LLSSDWWRVFCPRRERCRWIRRWRFGASKTELIPFFDLS
jgi:hypothetical protein